MPKGMPSYLRHRKGLGFARICGRDYYFGPHEAQSSLDAYHRLIAQWVAAGRPKNWAGPDGGRRKVDTRLLVSELLSRYSQHVESYYRNEDGRQTTEVDLIMAALSELRRLYAATPAAEIGPQQLRIVRDALVDRDKLQSGAPEDHRPRVLARSTINRYVGQIVRLFRWGAEHELVPPSVYHALKSVAPLKRGRSRAPEAEGVRPVPDSAIAATLPHLTETVRDMVRLTLLTGMRPGEVVRLCGRDLTPIMSESGEVWVYTPPRHKTAHHGRSRAVYMGPQAVALIRDRMPKDLDRPVFLSARGRGYTVNGYESAIERAAAKAGAPHWSPNQLRHNFATRVRTEATLDAAQVLLGHAHAATTEIYADVNRERALGIIRRIG